MIEQIEKTVKPRKTVYTVYPVVSIRELSQLESGEAIRRKMALFESGELIPVADIDWRTLPPHLVVGVNIPRLLTDLDRRYPLKRYPNWQWQANDRSLEELGGKAVRARTIVDYFGFTDPQRKKHHYHRCIDALTFYQNDAVLTRQQMTIEGLLAWAKELLAFCERHNLAIKSTASGLSAQFLRDPRCYPEPRRKVPRATNAAVRPALPGNHYQLGATTKIGASYQAVEVDQKRAHHYHAEKTPLPDADTLFAFGDFENLEEVTYAHCDRLPNFHGLYYMQLQYRTWIPGRAAYLPTELHSFRMGETRGCFVWTNELSMLRASGFHPMGIIAGWGSGTKDVGLSRYSRIAQHELDLTGEAGWVKPILLTTYGILAVNPRTMQAVYKQSDKGEPCSLIAGGREWLHGFLVSHTRGKKVEPGIANVLHRGLIESATRAETIGLARWLLRAGVRVLQVYADSLIVEDDASRPIPPLPAPWRIKQPLTDFRPVNVQAFTSIQKTRLPGITRAELPATSLGTFGRAPRLRTDLTPTLTDPMPF